MKRWAIVTYVLFTGLTLAAYANASLAEGYPSTIIRYKMTVKIETPEGVQTGSSVREISMVSRPKLMGENNDTHVKLERGEAVVIDLGKRGNLFALLQGNGINAIWTFFKTFPSGCADGPISRCGINYYANLEKGKAAQVTADDYPMFVSFKDNYDPNTVTNIRDTKPCPDLKANPGYQSRCLKKDHFERIFGSGVKLRSVLLEVTEEPVTISVEKWLPWLHEKKGVAGVIGSTKDKILYQGNLGLTGIEFSN